jgi:hypothetical protein
MYTFNMQKIHKSIQINAPREKVWEVMFDDATYRDWTTAFNPGSHFVGDWSEGSKILFLGPTPGEEDGKEGGMVSRIVENRAPEFMSIEHLGLISDGVEDLTSDEAKKWAPAFENYTLTEKDGGTELAIDQDVNEEYKEMFEGMWENALKRVKELSEA